MRFLVMTILTLFTASAFATGSVTQSKTSISYDGGTKVRVVTLAWAGDASTGTVPDTTVAKIHGYLMKMVTDPGSTAPTANYDIVFNSPDGDDALNAAGANRSASATEAAYPVHASGTIPVFMPPGTYTFSLSNNTAASATGTVKLYFIDHL